MLRASVFYPIAIGFGFIACTERSRSIAPFNALFFVEQKC